MKNTTLQGISIMILSLTLIVGYFINVKQDKRVDNLEQSIRELKWDYISHKKIEECVGLDGQMEYEGGSDCYTKERIYRWDDGGNHWRIYKDTLNEDDTFEDWEIFRMNLN